MSRNGVKKVRGTKLATGLRPTRGPALIERLDVDAADEGLNRGIPRKVLKGVVEFDTPLPWLLSALKTKARKGLTNLDLTRLVPIIDAFQNGWAVSTYPTGQTVQPAGTGTQTLDISRQLLGLTSGADLSPFAQRVIAISYLSTIVAAGSVVVLQAQAPSGLVTQLSRVTLAANPSNVATRDILGFDATLPPGYALQVVMPTTAGGESVTVTTVLQVAPAGFSF